MTLTYLKRGQTTAPAEAMNLSGTVAALLADLEAGREGTALRLSQELDHWHGEIVLSDQAVSEACARVPQQLKDDIAYAHENIACFAKAQRASITETEVELRPGLFAGQRLIPVNAAGCYVPGGRYSHIASAMMTVTTAKVAGVAHIAAVSPPRADAPSGIPDAIIYTLHYCGADRILALGGIQGVAALAFGLFGLPPADILVGPGNQYVAEAKRLLYGRVGIDMVAGPSEIVVVADAQNDPEWIAADLLSQAEHDPTSQSILFTDNAEFATQVAAAVDAQIATLSTGAVARASWTDFGAIIVVADLEGAMPLVNRLAAEHLELAVDDDRAERLFDLVRHAGSVFLGRMTPEAIGDYVAGPNHVLPTGRRARFASGLSVLDFMKRTSFIALDQRAIHKIGPAAATLADAEGLPAHAASVRKRL
jgi:histidinol dehydrogenase